MRGMCRSVVQCVHLTRTRNSSCYIAPRSPGRVQILYLDGLLFSLSRRDTRSHFLLVFVMLCAFCAGPSRILVPHARCHGWSFLVFAHILVPPPVVRFAPGVLKRFVKYAVFRCSLQLRRRTRIVTANTAYASILVDWMRWDWDAFCWTAVALFSICAVFHLTTRHGLGLFPMINGFSGLWKVSIFRWVLQFCFSIIFSVPHGISRIPRTCFRYDLISKGVVDFPDYLVTCRDRYDSYCNHRTRARLRRADYTHTLKELVAIIYVTYVPTGCRLPLHLILRQIARTARHAEKPFT